MEMARVVSIDAGKLLQGSWESWVSLESVGPINESEPALSCHSLVVCLSCHKPRELFAPDL